MRTVERYLADWRLTTLTFADGVVRLLPEEVEAFFAGPFEDAIAKVYIPRLNDGLSPLQFVRKTIFLRNLFSLKAPPRKPWLDDAKVPHARAQSDEE